MNQFKIALVIFLHLAVISLHAQVLRERQYRINSLPGFYPCKERYPEALTTLSHDREKYQVQNYRIYLPELLDKIDWFRKADVVQEELLREIVPDKFNKILDRERILSKSIASNEFSNSSARVWEAWVQHYASGLAPGYDVAVDIVADAMGNVYVTGYSSDSCFGIDYLTIKYDASGKEIWTARYNGENSGEDRPCALAVDDLGNVYVTGGSWNRGNSYDYATVKYNSSGVHQWVASENFSSRGSSFPSDIAVDDSGNIYVTGAATIKYDTNGTVKWIKQNSKLYGGRVYGVALAVDNTGNCYVTGTEYISMMGSDYMTIKFDSQGEKKWAVTYSGPAYEFDYAEDIAIDEHGNVYVTGYSWISDSGCDYATVKYNSSGNQQWVNRYNGSANGWDRSWAIAVDSIGNVYVTGNSQESNNDYDCTTIKYNSSGAQVWINHYNGYANKNDEANDLALDGSGNVYVTGCSWNSSASIDYITLKYNPSGQQEWDRRYHIAGNAFCEANALTIDANDNVYVTGESWIASSERDYATIKYSSSGIEHWIARYDSPGSSDGSAINLVVDSAGNVNVTGYDRARGTYFDFATVQYNNEGVQHWVNRYNNIANLWDSASDLVVDNAGNVYVTGDSYAGSSTFSDYITIKYDFAGAEQWIVQYNGPGNYNDEPTAIAVDKFGNVYVTGKSYGGSGSRYDFATIKYNVQGIQDWVSRYNGPGNADDWGNAIVVDASGNIYVTGSSQVSNACYEFATIKYSPSGEELWVARYQNQENWNCYTVDLAVDDFANIYVTGYGGESSESFNYITIKYNKLGQEEWIRYYNGPQQSRDQVVGMVVDKAGNVYVTGNSMGIEDSYYITYDCYVTVKYSSSGEEQWIKIYDNNENIGHVNAIALDSLGNIYIAGYTSHSDDDPNNYDFITIKYDPIGEKRWNIQYDGPEHSTDEARAIAVDVLGKVYVTGTSYKLGWSIFTTIKYEQIQECKIPDSYSLFQNYPNPFNNSTTIRYTVPQPCFVTLEIFNLLGQKVSTLLDTPQPPGDYELPWQPDNLSSGVYVYRLQAGDFKETKKMLLLR